LIKKEFAKHLEKSNPGFRLRGHEIKRIETLSDAVFALAVTLLIVSLEVPKNFEELMSTVRGFFAFGVSFLLLMLIWYEQNVFFRRYDLDDPVIISLNCFLIFVVLFYVYPLKFLFTFLFGQIYGNANSIEMSGGQWRSLMLIYSAGFIAVYLIFFFMYAHALRKRRALELNRIEEFDTRSRMYASILMIAVGVLSALFAIFLPATQIDISGIVYSVIGPVLTIFYIIRSKRRKSLP
jgi:uncharacterized membrane protein